MVAASARASARRSAAAKPLCHVPTSASVVSIWHPSALGRVRLAGAFRPVDPERVQLRILMQEPGLRRHRDRQLRGPDQDRLAQLAVPAAVAELATLESGNVEIGRL